MHEFTRVGIELTDGRNFSIKGRKPQVDHRDYPSISMRFPGTKTEPEFIWQGNKINETAYSFQLHVKNTTSSPLPVEKMIVYTTGLEGKVQVAHAPLPLSDPEELLSQFYLHDASKPLPWMAQIRDAKGGQSFLGFTTAKEQQGFIAIKDYGERSEATAFTLAEGARIEFGETLSSEKILVSFEKNSQKAIEIYTKTFAKQMVHALA